MMFFFIFDFDLVGNLPHGRPITISNSRSENLIGLPANLNQASYFLLTFRCLGIKYFANLPIKPVYRLFPESCQMKRPLSELKITLIVLENWYDRNLTTMGSSLGANIMSGIGG